jgi:hypothetical protein
MAEMTQPLRELDVVALTADEPRLGLYAGQVGTIVDMLDDGVYEVEFVSPNGETYAMAALRDDQLLQLKYEPVAAA